MKIFLNEDIKYRIDLMDFFLWNFLILLGYLEKIIR